MKAPENESEVRFLNVLTATSTETPRPVSAKYSSEGEHDCVTLSLTGKKLTFRFNKTGDIGGTVSVGKRTRPLTQDVQPQAGVILN